MATPWLKEDFNPDLLITHLEGIVPFIVPDDILPLTLLAVEKELIQSRIKEELEAMHERVTPQQKFRYLIWAIYFKKSSVNVFLKLLASLPSGKNIATDYKRNSSPSAIKNLVNKIKKKKSTYDWLVKQLTDPNTEMKCQPIVYANDDIICLDERNEEFYALLEGCTGPIRNHHTYDWQKK